MPHDRITGAPWAETRRSSGRLLVSPEAIFHADTPTRSSSSTASIENGELTNARPASSAWSRRPCHWASVNSMRRQ